MKKVKLTIQRKNGLHVRIAAELIVKLQQLFQDHKILKNIYIEFKDRCIQVTNLLAIVSLKIGQNEQFIICFPSEVKDSDIKEVINQLQAGEQKDSQGDETDRLLMENSVIIQEAVANLPNGMIVVNQENTITYVNESVANLTGLSTNEIINKGVMEIFPTLKLNDVLNNDQTHYAVRNKLNRNTIIENSAPIKYNNKTIGAVSIIQDITDIESLHSELQRERELQERLNLVLESVSDLIALTDEEGNFSYMNIQMIDLLTSLDLNSSVVGLISKKEWEELRAEKKPSIKIMNLLKLDTYILKIRPVLIDCKFKGAVVTLSPYHEIKSLIKKIEIMEQRTKYLELELSRHMRLDQAFQTIIGNSQMLLDTLSMANKVSKTNSTVLITGESGTGKELVARAIHESSNRKEQPFVSVNCAAIPPNLIESELFGHERGAFTGAYKVHIGKFELANNGSIFLDEIGDLNLDLQAKLLRVLQERAFERVGGYKTINLNIRLITATHQNLKELVEKGKFREDLYYRLHVIPIHLPSLRNRKEDIPLLVDHFRQILNEELGKNINGYEAGFLEALGEYHWPGNIRELKNIMERVMTLTENQTLHINDLPYYIFSKQDSDLQITIPNKVLKFEEYERQIYEHTAQFYPSYNQLSQALGVTHKTVANKLRKYELNHLLGKKYQED